MTALFWREWDFVRFLDADCHYDQDLKKWLSVELAESDASKLGKKTGKRLNTRGIHSLGIAEKIMETGC